MAIPGAAAQALALAACGGVQTPADDCSPDQGTLPFPFGLMDPPVGNPSPGPSFDAYEELGIGWMEAPFENRVLGWEAVETEPGVYDFSAMDASLCAQYEHGLAAVYVTRPINALYGTSWVEGNLAATDEYPDGNLEAWQAYVRAVVERYDGDGEGDAACSVPIPIGQFQLVHELGPIEVDYWQNHRDQYAEVFAATHGAMKEACAGCNLAMPVPHLDDLRAGGDFLGEVLGHLDGQDLADVGFDYHHWSVDESRPITESWQTEGEDYRERVEYITRIQDLAAAHGLDTARIHILSNESGMGATEEMEPDQAAYLVRSYVASLVHGQTLMAWTRIYDYPATTPGPGEDGLWANIGLVHNPMNADGLSHEKLAYWSYQLMIEKLGAADFAAAETVIDGADGVYAYRLVRADTCRPVWVAWWDYWESADAGRDVTLPVGEESSVLVTDAVPAAASGRDLTDPSGAFATQEVGAAAGGVALTLGRSPVLVEAP